jgi:hypothetical protein
LSIKIRSAWLGFFCLLAFFYFSGETGSAEVKPLYRHVDAGTGGTEVQVLQARGCRHRRHGSEACTWSGVVLLEDWFGIYPLGVQKCGSRGPNTQLERHGCEVCKATEVWHHGACKSHGKCHMRHVDVGTGGTELKAPQARTCGFSRHGYQPCGCTRVWWQRHVSECSVKEARL